MQPQDPYGRQWPVPAPGRPLSPPAAMPMQQAPTGWRPGPAMPPLVPLAQPSAAHQFPPPPPRPVYLPPVAYGAMSPRRPPPGKPGLAFALVAACVGVVLVIVGLIVNDKMASSVPHGTVSTKSTTARANGSTSPSLAPTTDTTEPRSTTTTTTRKTTTTRPKPRPTAPPPPPGPEPVAALGDHPLFANKDSGFTNAPCSTSTWPFDIPHAEIFYRELQGCVDPEWRRQLDGHHLPWSSPGLVVAGGYVSSPCGSEDFQSASAFYCPANQTLYVSIVGMPPGRYGNNDGIYLAVYAHEYGHHVQSLSGMDDAYLTQRSDVGAYSPQGLELSRRMELQAQCFSGMFLGSRRGGTITPDQIQRAGEDQYRGDQPGELRNHGSSQHTYAWWWQGSQYNRLWQCNTWLAPSDEVS